MNKKCILFFTALAVSTPIIALDTYAKPDDGQHYEFEITFDEIKQAFSKKSFDQEVMNLDSINTSEAPVKTEEKLDVEKIKFFAEKGNPNFQFSLGKLYDRGEYIEQDFLQAAHWYEMAANQGESRAQNNLGCLYLDGEGVDKDFEKALYWFEKSAKQDNSYAILNIGEYYREVKKDYKTAMKYYKKAEKLEPKLSWYLMGLLYKDGLGVKKDLKKAKTLFKKSADKGFKEAAEALAEMK